MRFAGWLLLVAIAIGFLPARATAQTTAPSLTVTARIVVLDVVVTDRHGRVVDRVLGSDDFTVEEDGVPQTIRSFETPAAHTMPPAAAGRPLVNSAADLPMIGEAPVTVLVLDELNSRFEDASYARQMLVAYLQAQPAVLSQPALLLVAENSSFTQLHDYTQDRDALIAALHHHKPQYPWRLENGGRSGSAAVERMAQVLAALDQIAQASQGTPGRKNLVWMGNGFSTSSFTNLPAAQAATIEAAVRRCTARLLAARVTLYPVNPTADQSSTVAVDSVDDLSQTGDDAGRDPFGEGSVSFAQLGPATGGISFAGRNDLNDVIGESLARGQRYYTLSYSPTGSSIAAAAFRRIRVRLRDPALRATTREGYYPAALADLNPVIDPNMGARQVAANLKLDLSNALTGTMSYNGLAISALPDTAGYAIHVAEPGIGWSEPQPAGRQQAEATVAAAWYDARGRLIGHVAREETCARTAEAAGALYRLPVTLPAGAVRVRIVVRDARTGRMGTTDLTPRDH